MNSTHAFGLTTRVSTGRIHYRAAYLTVDFTHKHRLHAQALIACISISMQILFIQISASRCHP